MESLCDVLYECTLNSTEKLQINQFLSYLMSGETMQWNITWNKYPMPWKVGSVNKLTLNLLSVRLKGDMISEDSKTHSEYLRHCQCLCVEPCHDVSEFPVSVTSSYMIFYIKQIKIMSMPQWCIVLIFLALWYPFPKSIYIIQFLHADSISLTSSRARHPTLRKLLWRRLVTL